MVARSSGPNSGSHRSSEPNIPRQPQSSNPADRNGRDAGIRTRDPLNPIQVRYQTAPRPDRRRAFEQARGAVSNAPLISIACEPALQPFFGFSRSRTISLSSLITALRSGKETGCATLAGMGFGTGGGATAAGGAGVGVVFTGVAAGAGRAAPAGGF